MKTLAELKRKIKVGAKIKKHYGIKTDDRIRTVNKVQTNGFYMDGSWLDYPKSTLIEFDKDNENMFTIYFPKLKNETGFAEFDYTQKGDIVGKYEIIGDLNNE